MSVINDLVDLCIDISYKDVCYQVLISPYTKEIVVCRVVHGSVKEKEHRELSEKGAKELIDWIHIAYITEDLGVK